MEKNKQEVCEVYCIDEEIVSKVKSEMLQEKIFAHLGDFFKIFGDPTRLKILFALAQKEMCVCDLANVLEMSQSAISHQLRLLRQNKLVKNRKEGKIVYYSLDDEHVLHVFNQGLEHIRHNS